MMLNFSKLFELESGLVENAFVVSGATVSMA
jgi:hypothetical protein